jgi:hypothetical protein
MEDYKKPNTLGITAVGRGKLERMERISSAIRGSEALDGTSLDLCTLRPAPNEISRTALSLSLVPTTRYRKPVIRIRIPLPSFKKRTANIKLELNISKERMCISALA